MKQLNPHTFAKFNTIGFYTLYYKEVKRFTSIITQTIIGPIITGLLFLFIFKLSVGHTNIAVGHLSFTQFLIPGLIMMNVLQNAFANTSSSLVAGKMMGSIVDLTMPPLSPLEIVSAMSLAGITRGIVIGVTTGLAMWVFSDISIYNVFYAIAFMVMGSAMMAIIGVLAGLWSNKWESIASVTTYVITPLSFLSGTFYSIDRLPQIFQKLAYFNPFFYVIDGFRYGMTGYSDGNPITGLIILSILISILGFTAHFLLAKGWNLKS